MLTLLLCGWAAVLAMGWQLAHATAGPISQEIARPAARQEAATSGASAPLQVDANETGPRIAFEKVAHDFGEVVANTTTTSEFLFGNYGDRSLRIMRIEECCGFAATLSKMQYEPGETGTLRAQYHAGPQPATMRRQLVVHTNDPTQPAITLNVMAQVVERVSYDPRRLIFLSGDKQALCPKIRLTSLDGKPFAIVGFVSTGNCLAATYEPSRQQAEFVLEPSVNAERLQPGMTGMVTIRLTHPECETITIPFRAPGPFEASPPQLIVQEAEPGKSIIRNLRVRSNYQRDFAVKSMSSLYGFTRMLSQRKVADGYEFDIEITPPAVDGSGRAFTDVLSLNMEGGERLTVSCRGFYVKPSTIQGDLTPEQKTFVDWTEGYFAPFLHRTEYANLSGPTRLELEQMWIGCLERQAKPLYYEAINGLAAIKSKKAVMSVLRVAIDPEQPDDRARWMAVRALGILGDDSVVPHLIHLIYHYHQNTRFWAQISLVRLTGVNFGYDWQRWGQWWNERNGTPPFLPASLAWSTEGDASNVANLQEEDRQFIESLRR